ncbi:MAG: HAD family hydrolase [Pirellulales bacterium]
MDFAALIFDCDGTLADTMPAHYIAWQRTMDKYGIKFSEDRFYSMGGKPSDKIIEILSEEQGLQLDAPAVAKEKEQFFLDNLDAIEPIHAVTDIVHEYQGKIPMAVATGAMRWVMDLTLEQIGLDGMFDASVASEDTELHKPHPDVFLEAARRLNVDPTQCRAYEDAVFGVESAQRAGMDVVDITTFFTPRRITP